MYVKENTLKHNQPITWEAGKEIRLPAYNGEPHYNNPDNIRGKHAALNGGRRNFNHALQWFFLTDALALVFAFASAWILAMAFNSIFLGRDALANPFSGYGSARIIQFTVIGAGCLLWFYHSGHYRMRMPFWLESNKIVAALSFAVMVDCFFLFAEKQDFSRLWLMSGWVIAAAFMIGLRGVIRMIAQRRGKWSVSTLLVGNGITARNTHMAMLSEKSLGYKITAQIGDLLPAFLHAGRSWETLCDNYKVDYVIIALDGENLAQANLPVAQLMRESVPFSISPPLNHLPVMGMMPQYFINHDVMLLAHSNGLGQPLPRLIKRSFDMAVSGSLLLVASPLFLFIAAMVKRDGGPAFFGHPRIGRGGVQFSCLKFRSMITNSAQVLQEHLNAHPEAQKEWKETQKLKNDPRITRFGAFLRRSSLDELPQLLNVLKGEMSLVGPRPIIASEVPKYDGDIAYYHSVNPGITGLWQVSGRNDVSYAQRVQMDCWYVRNWSLWHDLAILLKTLPALMKRSGAY